MRGERGKVVTRECMFLFSVGADKGVMSYFGRSSGIYACSSCSSGLFLGFLLFRLTLTAFRLIDKRIGFQLTMVSTFTPQDLERKQIFG